MNTVADKTVDVNNKQDIMVDQKLNAAADDIINADKKQDAVASR